MASENAKRAATKVVESLGTGKKVNMGKILREVGYSDNTSGNPQEVTGTKSYQSVVMPFLEKLEAERNRILMEISTKDLDNERHTDLVRSLDTLTKNVQLLSGKETERAGVNINVINYGDSPT
jgi:hypothetical protein